VYVVNTAANAAPDVIMVFGGSVETSLSARDVHFEDLSFVRQDLKIAVHCCNTDLRESVSDKPMEFVRGRMAGKLPEFVQDDFSLLSHSSGWSWVHEFKPIIIAIANQ
jgi:hypothetical protein